MSRPLIGILRGIKPSEASEICAALIDAGITRIEVPLNSPDPFDSIAIMLDEHDERADIGAGTVLSIEDVDRLASLGGHMVVSPNCNRDIILATKSAGMKSYPGVLTPTECFSALDAGADGLKIFPSNLIGPRGLIAMKSVLPDNTKTYPVGGVDASNFSYWIKAGATGFGVGTALYKPGMSADEVSKTAKALVADFDACVKNV